MVKRKAEYIEGRKARENFEDGDEGRVSDSKGRGSGKAEA